MSTPNMTLVLPTDHGSSDVWDTILDAVFARIDLHNHTTGLGVQVPSAGLNMNADLSFANSGTPVGVTNLKTTNFAAVAAAVMTTYAGALFVNSADSELYYRTTGGVNVKVTAGAALNVAAFTGGIGGDYSAVGALELFDDATDSYWLQQQGAPRPWAGLRVGNVDIYQQAASIATRVRLMSPASLAASYALTLFTALPASQVLVQVDASGNMFASNTLPNNTNVTIQGTGHILRGNRQHTVPVRATMSGNVSGGGATTPSVGMAGAGCPASSSNTFFCPPPTTDEQLLSIVSVDVYACVAGGSVTFTLQGGTSAGNFAPITGASASTSSLARYTKFTLTPTTPFVINTLGGGLFMALNVAPGVGVTTCDVLSVVYNTTVVT